MQEFFVRKSFRYLFFFFCFFVLWNASIWGALHPFAIGLALALVWCGEKLFLVLPIFALASLLCNFSFALVLGVSVFIVIIALACGIHTKLKKTISFPLFAFYASVAQGGFLAYDIFVLNQVLFGVLEVICAVLFMWATKTIFSSLLTSQNIFKPGTSEKIFGLVFLGAMASGLYTITLLGVPLIFLFAPFLILLLTSLQKISATTLLASVLGIGVCISGGNGLLTTPFVIWAIIAGAMCGAPKILSVMSLLVVDLVMGYGLGLYAEYSTVQFIFTAVSGFAFCLLPKDVLHKFQELFSLSNDFAMRNVVNQSRATLCKRLWELSDTFAEMDYVFRSMIKGGMTKEEVKFFLINEVKDKVCTDCPERNICHRKCHTETSSVLQNLIASALERGKATLLDAPAYLTTRCGRVPRLVSEINSLTTQYRKYASAMNNIDASRVLIADELKGLSGIFKNLATEVNKNITFDKARENQIISELAFNNITCADALIYEENLNFTNVTLIVRKQDTQNQKIEEIVSKICRSKMALTKIESSKRAGWNVLSLSTAPKFAMAFGSASIKKDTSKVSGDAYSIIKLAHDKFLLALCDGMGSGENAQKTASIAISLVENFYKAGFDNEIILSSVNKLLSLNSTDNFTALDICVLDMQNGTLDFIKMGAPESFIKHIDTTTKILGGTLPLGIVQDAEPVVIKQIISNGDFVFMFTDGITESFETEEMLEDFINNLSSLNPQTLADEVIKKAHTLSGGARDDMTVLVAKIFSLK